MRSNPTPRKTHSRGLDPGPLGALERGLTHLQQSLSLRHLSYMPRWESRRRIAGPCLAVGAAALAGHVGAQYGLGAVWNDLMRVGAGALTWVLANTTSARMQLPPPSQEETTSGVDHHLRTLYAPQILNAALQRPDEPCRYQFTVGAEVTQGCADPERAAWEGASRAVEALDKQIKAQYRKRRVRGLSVQDGSGSLRVELIRTRPGTAPGHRIQVVYRPPGKSLPFETAPAQAPAAVHRFARETLLPLLETRLREPGPVRIPGELLAGIEHVEPFIQAALREATVTMNHRREAMFLKNRGPDGNEPRPPHIFVALQPYAIDGADPIYSVDFSFAKPEQVTRVARRLVTELVKRLSEQLTDVGADGGIKRVKVEDFYFAHTHDPSSALKLAMEKLLKLNPDLHAGPLERVDGEAFMTVRVSLTPLPPARKPHRARQLRAVPPPRAVPVSVDLTEPSSARLSVPSLG